MNVFIVQTIIILILAFVIIYLIRYNNSLKLERRIAKYSIDSIKDKPISLFDLFSNEFKNTINKISKVLKKNKIISKYSLRYNKYISYDKIKEVSSIDYVSMKIVIAIMFLLVITFAKIIEGSFPSLILIIFSVVFGFFVIDIYFGITNYIKKVQVEQELLNAITIMNNAFRSGRSTMQAIEIVSQELKGPIKQEFRKMHLEISYGLSLDVVFERFSKRVDSEEVNYITSSLSILNKTGGNIIKVFSSIEKMLFDKRKLKQEMNSLTASSRMISKFLLFMPIIFVLIIFLISSSVSISYILSNPLDAFKLFFTDSYFASLFSTTLGNILLVLIIIIYASYIFVIKKVLKVRF